MTLNPILAFFSGVPKLVWAGIAALVLLGGTVAYCRSQVEERVELAEEKGQITEQNKQYEQTIINIKEAEQAREEINQPGPTGDLTRYNQCLRSARTPENCKRFLPDVQKTDSGG